MSELQSLYFGKTKEQHVKDFAGVFAIIFILVATWFVWKYQVSGTPTVLCSIATILLALGYFLPAVLLPVWEVWMKFAHILGSVVTSVILWLAWTLMMVPISILLKIIGKKVMDTSFDRKKASYWEERSKKLHDFNLLERQF